MSIQENLQRIERQLISTPSRLIAVTKTKPVEALREAYQAGCQRFGENKVQEMAEKHAQLPHDVEWHLIGHLQTNKVKSIASFVHLIHSVDSLRLLQEIDRQAAKHQRVVDCLIQIHIAREETKFGLSEAEAEELLRSSALPALPNVRVVGLMGMATYTDDQEQIRGEFRGLKAFFEKLKNQIGSPNVVLRELSMGMSNDYPIAVEEGSTLIRVGSAIFGAR
ncbi:MAG: YggS family pyridoxal phosphate-dependent enzyme [Ferruginibacter sp.]|nr:YggS family pyridoxal phosphate-dependent enzyme [Cytophagales bacterium]